jgi:hypothetical protein
MEDDIKEIIIKSACAESDKLEQRRFKVAQILADVNYENKEEKDMVIASFVKSAMSYEEIEEFARWRKETTNAKFNNNKVKRQGVA